MTWSRPAGGSTGEGGGGAATSARLLLDHAGVPTTEAAQGALFVSDGTDGLVAGDLYYRYESDGTIVAVGGSTKASYTNRYGQGWRVPEIGVAYDGVIAPGDPALIFFVAGLILSNVTFFASGTATGKRFILTFPELVCLQGLIVVQDFAQSQGMWQVAGSVDGITYTDIDVPFEWGVGTNTSAGSYTEKLLTNTASYMYYRITLVSGTTTNGPYQRGFLFKTKV